MSPRRYTSDEIARLGQALYDQKIRAQVEPGNKGKFLALDIETGDYEVDEDSLAAYERAAAKHADPVLYILRVGYPAAVRLGGRSLIGWR